VCGQWLVVQQLVRHPQRDTSEQAAYKLAAKAAAAAAAAAAGSGAMLKIGPDRYKGQQSKRLAVHVLC
jgi:hypothetical protein